MSLSSIKRNRVMKYLTDVNCVTEIKYKNFEKFKKIVLEALDVWKIVNPQRKEFGIYKNIYTGTYQVYDDSVNIQLPNFASRQCGKSVCLLGACLIDEKYSKDSNISIWFPLCKKFNISQFQIGEIVEGFDGYEIFYGKASNFRKWSFDISQIIFDQ